MLRAKVEWIGKGCIQGGFGDVRSAHGATEPRSEAGFLADERACNDATRKTG